MKNSGSWTKEDYSNGVIWAYPQGNKAISNCLFMITWYEDYIWNFLCQEASIKQVWVFWEGEGNDILTGKKLLDQTV